MENIFLTSSISYVAHDIPKYLAKKASSLKLIFINTAAEVEEGDLTWLRNDRNALVKTGFQVSDYTISGKTKNQIQNALKDIDVIYFSGGNQFYLLEKIQKSGCAQVLCDYVKNGKIYIGCSAGSIIAGPDIYITRLIDAVSKASNLKSYKGLGLVDFIVFPHWGSTDFKELYLNRRLINAYVTKYKIILLTDYQYIRIKVGWYQIMEVK